jgi:ABC-type sulfate/molybdate transport systems ATPase subunit
MLALSRALTTNPTSLLLDEISVGLAPRLVEELFRVIKEEVAARRVSVLIVEQLAEFALGIADTAVVMSRGSVRAVGTAAEVKDCLDAAYLGGDDSVRPNEPLNASVATMAELAAPSSRGPVEPGQAEIAKDVSRPF